MTSVHGPVPEGGLQPRQFETPVTMERAFAFGFKAGVGFIAAQIVFGVALFVLYLVMPYTLTSLLHLAAG